MSKKIIAAGHICLDITPLFPKEKTGAVKDLLLPGTLLRMEGADVHTGGSVANTGLALRFFGAEAVLMGKVGDDAFGRMIMDILAAHGCGSEGMVLEKGGVSSYSVVLAIPGQDRIFLHAPGVNDSFCCADLDFARIAEAQHFHFGYPPLMRKMYENNGKELAELFRRVKELGLSTSLDMAAVDPASEAGQQDWKEILRAVLPYVDDFLPSAEELCFMLDRARYNEWMQRGGDIAATLEIERDIRPLAEELMAMGAHTLLIKCGAKGLYYRTAEVEGFQKSFVPEKVCSATGAGDTCIAAFLAATMEGKTLESAVRLAAAAGAACVSAYDALSGLKPLTELETKIGAGWKVQEV